MFSPEQMCTTNVVYVVAVFFASDSLSTSDATFVGAQVDIPVDSALHSLPPPQHYGSEHIVPSIPGYHHFIIIIMFSLSLFFSLSWR